MLFEATECCLVKNICGNKTCTLIIASGSNNKSTAKRVKMYVIYQAREGEFHQISKPAEKEVGKFFKRLRGVWISDETHF